MDCTIVRTGSAQKQGRQRRQGAQPQGRCHRVNDVGDEMYGPARALGGRAMTRPREAGGHDQTQGGRHAPERATGFQGDQGDKPKQGGGGPHDHRHAQGCAGDHKGQRRGFHGFAQRPRHDGSLGHQGGERAERDDDRREAQCRSRPFQVRRVGVFEAVEKEQRRAEKDDAAGVLKPAKRDDRDFQHGVSAP